MPLPLWSRIVDSMDIDVEIAHVPYQEIQAIVEKHIENARQELRKTGREWMGRETSYAADIERRNTYQRESGCVG